jgi:hypothetical protein
LGLAFKLFSARQRAQQLILNVSNLKYFIDKIQ